jgi:hypothetical protein
MTPAPRGEVREIVGDLDVNRCDLFRRGSADAAGLDMFTMCRSSR